MSIDHSNIFRTFERTPDYYEDLLSRAAVLLMRHVPLAYQCLLDLAAPDSGTATASRFSIATLPPGVFSVQRKPSHDDRARNLLSVFLTPEPGPPERPVPVDLGMRQSVRHDGFIKHGEELIVVIEAKRRDQPDYEQARCPGPMEVEHAGNVRFVSWTALVDQWLALDENGLLAHAEAALLEDFMELLGENEQINPFSRLSRCRGRVQPTGRRLQVLLGAALGRPVEPLSLWWGSGGRLDGLGGSASRLVLSYYAPEDRIRLRLWPAIRQGEKDIFYSDKVRLDQLAASNGMQSGGHWTLHVEWMLELKPPRFDVCTVTLEGGSTDVGRRLRSIAELADRLNVKVQRMGVAAYLKDFVAAGLTTQDVVDNAVAEIEQTNFSEWKVVASAEVYCAWMLKDATRLDTPGPHRNQFEDEVRQAAEHLVAFVGATLP